MRLYRAGKESGVSIIEKGKFIPAADELDEEALPAEELPHVCVGGKIGRRRLNSLQKSFP